MSRQVRPRRELFVGMWATPLRCRVRYFSVKNRFCPHAHVAHAFGVGKISRVVRNFNRKVMGNVGMWATLPIFTGGVKEASGRAIFLSDEMRTKNYF